MIRNSVVTKYLVVLVLCIISLSLRAQVPDSLQLKTYNQKQLVNDYDLLINSLKEAHTGLYWYNSKVEFDNFSRSQRKLVRPGMTGLDLYRIIAPVISFTKEGHTALKLSQPIQDYMRVSARYLPAFIKIVSTKLYLINNLPGVTTRGCELLSVNGISADSKL